MDYTQEIEVDHEKTLAILGIPPPKNVKQLQSFLQTCSWYRKFIANFSEIARPLSNLTKKKAFWGYIDGASITVASDHQPLRWLMKLKSPTGRLVRWTLQLQSFNLNMEYIPGKSNVVADMLSRPACHEENECEVCTVAIDVPSRSPKEIRDEQMKDEELVKIISCLEDPDKNVNYVNWVEREVI
ncbi:retrovirus-related Pol polyprotein from transposon 17.6 [Trichonephila clavipes]|nr:retrovirus-related Pol polyprotein from transposon 17.6 [Trichonephila clavipes]